MTPAVERLIRVAEDALKFLDDVRMGRAGYHSQHEAVLLPRRLAEAITAARDEVSAHHHLIETALAAEVERRR